MKFYFHSRYISCHFIVEATFLYVLFVLVLINNAYLKLREYSIDLQIITHMIDILTTIVKLGHDLQIITHRMIGHSYNNCQVKS